MVFKIIFGASVDNTAKTCNFATPKPEAGLEMFFNLLFRGVSRVAKWIRL
jgi:hypothetical protein